MAERELARVALLRRLARRLRGHDLERLALAHPRARLVARRERGQRRLVLRVVAAVVVVEPAQAAGVRDRDPEVEAVRHRGRGDVVAAREAAGRVGAAVGDDPVRGPRALAARRGGLDADVVEPAAERRRAVRVVVGDHDPVDRLAGRDLADARALEVPLVRVERLGGALTARRQARAVLVARAEVAQIRAVGEREVDGGVRARVAQVVLDEVRIDDVGELAAPAHRHVDVEDLVVGVGAAVGGVRAGVAQRLEPGEADAGLRGVAPARAAADAALGVRGRRGRGVAVGELDLGELDQVVAVVGGEVEPVVAVRGRVAEPVLPGLEALREVLARLLVELGPGRAVVRARERPVARVAPRRVVGRRQRVVDGRERLGELELHPAGGLEGEPLRLRRAVDEVLPDLARALVLRARADRDDLVGLVAGDLARRPRGPGDTGGAVALDRVDPRRLGVARLERRREVTRRRERGAREHQPGARQRAGDGQEPASRMARRHDASSNLVDPSLASMTTLSSSAGRTRPCELRRPPCAPRPRAVNPPDVSAHPQVSSDRPGPASAGGHAWRRGRPAPADPSAPRPGRIRAARIAAVPSRRDQPPPLGRR